jgi:hypothetical protein
VTRFSCSKKRSRKRRRADEKLTALADGGINDAAKGPTSNAIGAAVRH